MRMRLSSALDENEQLDNELVGHLVRQAQIRPAVSSPPVAQNTIEVRHVHKRSNEMHVDVDVSVTRCPICLRCFNITFVLAFFDKRHRKCPTALNPRINITIKKISLLMALRLLL